MAAYRHLQRSLISQDLALRKLEGDRSLSSFFIGDIY
jgi:hypothetical protein